MLKSFLFLNGLKCMIIISENMETVLLYIWTKYTFQSHLHVQTLIVQTITSFQDYIVPGWNDYVKELHSEARNCYIMWHNVGKPKDGPIYLM